MALRPLIDLAELDHINAQFATEPERVRALCDVYLAPPIHLNALKKVDPFDPAYLVAIRRWLAEITGRRDYAPARDELAPYLEEPGDDTKVVPSIYSFGDATFIGDMLQSYGAALKALDVRPGQSVPEYGPGDGQICLNLARMGCRVTAVDIEARYLGMIRLQARALGVTVQTIHAEFGTAEPGLLYDRILFFEAFHHALGHQDLMGRLRDQLAADGAIVFVGEPILEPTNYYRNTLPYAWGPRLDGLSLRAMRAHRVVRTWLHPRVFRRSHDALWLPSYVPAGAGYVSWLGLYCEPCRADNQPRWAVPSGDGRHAGMLASRRGYETLDSNSDRGASNRPPVRLAAGNTGSTQCFSHDEAGGPAVGSSARTIDAAARRAAFGRVPPVGGGWAYDAHVPGPPAM